MKVLILLGIICLSLVADAVQVNYDTSKANDLQNFASRVKATCEDWFPRVESLLRSPTYVAPTSFNIIFDPNYKGVAEAYPWENPPRIRGAVDYYRSHQDDVGSMIHEMAHVIQNYKKCDSWVTEGIADWVRYYHYEPNRKPSKPSSSNSYKQGYGIAAYFLNYIDSRWRGMLYYINKDCREGTYHESIFPRLTGKTVDQHWQDMLREG